jgi:hypothetical protein
MTDQSDIPNSNLHDEEVFQKAVQKGGLFDVGPNELDDDIGRHVRFPEAEEDPENDSLYNHEHVIVAVQKDYKGDLCYRVQLAQDVPSPMEGEEMIEAEEDLGRVAEPDEVEFVDEEGSPNAQ